MASQTAQLDRNRQIVRTSSLGIAANVLLATLKAAVGALTGSIAIVLDAVNNLSDALSSIITIVGACLALRPADHHHPYGHGRMEYLTAIVIASIILAAGVTSLRESIVAMLHPTAPSYDPVSLAIIMVTVGVKLALGHHFAAVGRRVASESLVASGIDATMDAAISSATVLAAILYLTLGIGTEAWLGAVISLIIIRSGMEMLRESLSKVLGERVDPEVAHKVKSTVEAIRGVRGAYDLFLHDYGPERMQGSVYVTVDETMTAAQIDALTKRVQEQVLLSCDVDLVAVGIYATNADGSEAAAMRSEVAHIVWAHEHVREMHGFYVDEGRRIVRFDVVIGFEDHDRDATCAAIVEECERAFPAYRFAVVLDSDVSD